MYHTVARIALDQIQPWFPRELADNPASFRDVVDHIGWEYHVTHPEFGTMHPKELVPVVSRS